MPYDLGIIWDNETPQEPDNDLGIKWDNDYTEPSAIQPDQVSRTIDTNQIKWDNPVQESQASQIEWDNPPAQTQIASGVKEYQPPEEPEYVPKSAATELYDFATSIPSGVVKSGLEAIKRIPKVGVGMWQTALEAIRRGDEDVNVESSLDKLINGAKDWNSNYKKLSQKERDEVLIDLPWTDKDITRGTIDETMQSIGYSVLGMIVQKLSGTVGGMVGGAIATPEAPIVGTITAGAASKFAGEVIGGTAFMTAATYDQFISQYQDVFNKVIEEKYPNITPEQKQAAWKKSYETIKGDAFASGLAEALPEVFGNMFIMGVAKGSKFGLDKVGLQKAKGLFSKSVAGKLSLKLGIPLVKMASMNAEELITETITQYFQSGREAKVGLRDKPQAIKESFLDVLPNILSQTTIIGAGNILLNKLLKPSTEGQKKKILENAGATDLLTGKTESTAKPGTRNWAKDLVNKVREETPPATPAAQTPTAPTYFPPMEPGAPGQYGPGAMEEIPEPVTLKQPEPTQRGGYGPEAKTELTSRETARKIEREGKPVYAGGAFVTPVEEKPAKKPAKIAEKPNKETFDKYIATLSDTDKGYIKDLIKDTEMSDAERLGLAKQEIVSRKQKSKLQYQKDLEVAQKETSLPTEAQIESGTYKKGRIRIHGYEGVIETPKGVERLPGIKVKHPVGYIRGVEGADKDQLDVIFGPEGETTPVFVVDQSIGGKFDEHKVMMGFRNESQARSAHKTTYRNYSKVMNVVEMTPREFKAWTKKADMSKPAAQTPPISEKQWLQEPSIRPPGYSTKKFLPGQKGARATELNRTVLSEYRQWLKNMGYSRPTPTQKAEAAIRPKKKDTRPLAIRELAKRVMDVQENIRQGEALLPESKKTKGELMEARDEDFQEHTDLNQDQQVSMWLAKIFGVDLAFYKGPRMGGSGVFVEGPNAIAIHANTEKPGVFVLMHEIVHNMKEEDPKTWKDLSRYLWSVKNVEEFNIFADALNATRPGNPLPLNPYRVENKGKHTVWDEYMAEGIAHQVFKEEFWNGLQKKNPSLFSRFVSYLTKIFDKIRGKIENTGTQNLAYFRDFEGSTMDEIQNALVAFSKRRVRANQIQAYEGISAAAIKYNGKIYTGITHADAFARIEDELREKPGTLEEKMMAIDWTQIENDGFLTTRGRYIDRDEAKLVAAWADQLGEDTGREYLVSEEIKWNRPKNSIEPKFQMDITVPVDLNKNFTSYSDASNTTGDKAKNILVQPGKKKGKYLFVQISSSGDRASAPVSNAKEGLADKYFDKLYSNRDGYVRPADFWEIPEWVGMAAKTFKDSDFYVVRNMKEAIDFLNQAGYKQVMFSAMDANKKIVKGIASGYNGDIIASGYIRKNYFKDNKNVTWVDSIEDAAKKVDVKYSPGVDYKHFGGTETIPRLELSRGCLHNCAFCVVPSKIVEANDSFINEQIESFKNLKFKLIYLNDKTFGQAKNYKKIADLHKRVQKMNPDFEGFIVQTTAPAFLGLDEDFLKKSGVKYVELGVETYNDDILKKLKKPHTTKLIDKAVEKIRKLRMNFVPNIIVGLAGVKNGKVWTENADTYKNTIDFLNENSDITSHVNVYVLATYEGTTLSGQLGIETEEDSDENVIGKSWMKNKKIHEKFYKDVLDFGGRQLDKPEPSLPYGKVPMSLMGFSKEGINQKGFYEQNYPWIEDVEVTFPGEKPFQDSIAGMNKLHAIARARINWEGAKIKALNGYKNKYSGKKDIQFQVDFISDIPKQAKGKKKNGQIGSPLGNRLYWMIPEMISDAVDKKSKVPEHIQVREYFKKVKEWRGFKITDAVAPTFANQVKKYNDNAVFKKEYNEIKDFREQIASGQIEYFSDAYNKMIDKYGPTVQLHTVKHQFRFPYSRTQLYGPVDEFDTKKTITKEHPIVGQFDVDIYTDPETGQEVIDGPMFSQDRMVRLDEIVEVVKKNDFVHGWYSDWNKFMNQWADKVGADKIVKYIKIQAILSAQRGPQGNQLLFADVAEILESGESLFSGELKDGGSGLSGPDVYKVQRIWDGLDTETTLEEFTETYGKKVGPYMYAGLHPMQEEVIVIDRHMSKPWGYNIMWDKEGNFSRLSIMPEVSAEVAGDIMEAARMAGVSYNAAQAALWFEIRKADVEAATYREAAQLQPDEYLPGVMYTETTPETLGTGLHYKNTLVPAGNFIYAASKDGKIKFNEYSRNDIGKRIDASTDQNPYAELVYAYEAKPGLKPEPYVSFGKMPHSINFEKSRIYNAVNDILGYMDSARKRVSRDKNVLPGLKGAASVNALANLIEKTGSYDGFMYRQNDKNVIAIFKEVAVTHAPESVTVALSDVVESIEKLPQSIDQIEKIFPERTAMASAGVGAMSKKYTGLTVDRFDGTIARFGGVTSGSFEIGGMVRINAPVDIAKAFAAEWGIARNQNMVFAIHASDNPTGTLWSVPVSSRFESAEQLEDELVKSGVFNINIGVKSAGGRLFIEQYFDDGGEFAPSDEDIDNFADFISAVKESNIPVEKTRVRSEVIDKSNYKKTLTDYFGETEGERVYNEAVKEQERYTEEVAKRQVGKETKGKGGEDLPPTTGPGKGPDLVQQVDVFHGSPFSFDKFTTKNIGTGEGAQAFGWGLYFTDKKSIAEHYRNIATRPDLLREQYGDVWKAAYYYTKGDKKTAIKILDEEITSIKSGIEKYGVVGKENEAIKRYGAIRAKMISGEMPKMGAVYKSTLFKGKDPSEYTWLDWYDPIPKEQINAINRQAKKETLGDIMPRVDEKHKNLSLSDVWGPFKTNEKGGALYRDLSGIIGDKNASLFLGRAGIDGIRYPSGTLSGISDSESNNYVVFDERAVTIEEKIIFNADLVVEKPAAVVDKIGPSANKSMFDKVKTSLDDFKKNFVTRNIDRLQPIKKWLGEGKAYMLSRGIPGIQSTIQAFLEHGKLKFDESGAIITDEVNKGFLEWYSKLGKDAEKFFYWVVAKRAQGLKKENREFLFDDNDIKSILDWVGDKPTDSDYSSWSDINNEFREFNRNIIDLAQRSGIIDSKFAEYMKSQGYYVPFYRVLTDPETRVLFDRNKLRPKEIGARIKKLKGSELPVGDPVENMIRNWTHLISESVHNVARRSAFNEAKRRGLVAYQDEEGNDVPLVEQVNWADTVLFKKMGKEKGAPTFISKKEGVPVLQFRAAGKSIYFKVNDPELFNALGQMDIQSFDNLFSKIAGVAKRGLTFGATFGPAFRIKNFLRDTLHTFQISKGFTPLWDSIAGLWKVWRKDADYIKFVSSGMAFGGSYIREGDSEGLHKYVNHVIKKEGKSALKRIIATPADAIKWWNEFGEGFENAARVQLYSKLKKKGVSHLEAAFRARDLMDFNMSGNGTAARILISTVPFLNARIQGLYRMGRGAAENPKSFFTKSAMIAMASLMLWWANKDDDRYKELEDFEKFAWYHFWIGDQHFRIPKPFETGVLFSTSMEVAGDVITGNEELSHVMDYLVDSFGQTLAFNPTPQLVRPVIEQFANKSFFTGRPIEPMGMQYREPGERFDPWNSDTLKLAGQAFNISPKRLEALITGYLSTFGMFVLGMSDIVVREFVDFPERPTKRIDDYPFLGALIRQGKDPRNTKYMGKFFDTLNDARTVTAQVNAYRREGDFKKAQEYAKKNRDVIRMTPRLNTVYRQIADISARMKQIWTKSNLTPDKKKEEIDRLTRQRNRLVKQVYEEVLRRK